jgi:hypothetical protein
MWVAPLWREDGYIFCICCWPLPAQCFSGPNPLGLTTIFYCPRFETYLFVTSYDSQGHGEGIWPRLLKVKATLRLTISQSVCQSQCRAPNWVSWPDPPPPQVKVTLQLTVSQSVNKSWCRAPSGAHDQIFITIWQLQSCFCGAPSLTRGWFCLLYMLLALASAVFLGSESLFVASYDSQDHGGGNSTLPPHWFLLEFTTALPFIAPKSYCDWRSVSQSWCQAQSGAHDHVLGSSLYSLGADSTESTVS